jgi:hypothetical protein
MSLIYCSYFLSDKAFIDDFKVNELHNITVNQSEILTLICYVDSNPVSNTEITFQNGTRLIIADSNNLSISLGPVKCLDSGSYACNGQNKYNMDRSKRIIFIYVNCKFYTNFYLSG